MKLSASCFFSAVALFLVAGCNTFEQRSQEKSSTFASLSPESKEKLKHGVIEIGNTSDMVYIALGAPDERHEKTTANGHETTWVYNTYHQEYEGNVHTGYHRRLVFDPAAKRYVVFYEPIITDIYSEHTEEYIRIKFVNDRVVEIEQPKPRT
jgi:hypothetical protein